MRGVTVVIMKNVKVTLRALLCLVTLSAIIMNPIATKAQGDKPNVVIILTDDQGYGDMSGHGNPYVQTPNMDRLQSESVELVDFHVDPTCAPTRAALMTGRYSAKAGVWLTYKGRHHLRTEEITMAEVFKENGYRTGIFGKWHLGDNYPFRPHDRGFDEVLIHSGGVVGEAPDYWGNDYYDDIYFRNGEPEKVNGYSTDVWFRQAKEFISSSREKPFFVYLPTNAAHSPYDVPREYVEPYLGRKGIPEQRAWFYGMIANIDENIGDFRQFLADNGVAENTILIFMTDNGTAQGVEIDGRRFVTNGYNAGMRGKKGDAYEGGHRATCLIHWLAENVDRHVEIDRLAAHIDILPTLMELADLTYPEPMNFDGTSLAPLLKGRAGSWASRTLLVHDQRGQNVENDTPVKYSEFSVMTEQWRLVGDGEKRELFQIQKDPGQETDLSAQKPEIVDELMEEYEQWWEDISGPFDSYARTIIGSEYQEEVKLTAQSWHGYFVPYSQQHLRHAIQANGFWDLEVARAGTYEIELRRWAKEFDKPINAVLPQPALDPQRYDIRWQLYNLQSKPVNAVKARLKVGSFDKTADIKPSRHAIKFDVRLEEGDVNLQTWLTNTEGESWGAYYVYIRPAK